MQRCGRHSSKKGKVEMAAKELKGRGLAKTKLRAKERAEAAEEMVVAAQGLPGAARGIRSRCLSMDMSGHVHPRL